MINLKINILFKYILSAVLFVSLVVAPLYVFAKSDCPPAGATTLQVPLPGVGTQCEDGTWYIPRASEGGGISLYVSSFFDWFVGLISLVAVVVIMIGGVRWLIAVGSKEKIQQAQGMIGGAVGTLVLVFVSFTALKIINPDIVNLTLTQPSIVEKVKIGVDISTINAPDSGLAPVGPYNRNNLRACHILPEGTYIDNRTTVEAYKQPAHGTSEYNETIKKYGCGNDMEYTDFLGDAVDRCFGMFCSDGRICIDVFGKVDPKFSDFKCLGEGVNEIRKLPTIVTGQLSYDGDSRIHKKQWNDIFSLNSVYLDGEISRITEIRTAKGHYDSESAYYELKLSFVRNYKVENILGFFIVFNMDDTIISDRYAVGRDCTTPILKNPFGRGALDPLDIEFPDGYAESKGKSKDELEAIIWKNEKDLLIQPEDILKDVDLGFVKGNIKTFRCDIRVSEDKFPSR